MSVGRGVRAQSQHGPLADANHVGGVAFDGELVWVACGSELRGLDPDSGEEVRRLNVPAGAGTAFDGRHLYQVGGGRIRKIDPSTGDVVHSVPVPPGGDDAGLTWAEGYLWLGKFRGGKILKLDPQTGEVLRTIEAPEYVTGVAWSGTGLWHAVDPPDEAATLRRIDPETGAELESYTLEGSAPVTGVSLAKGRLFCGNGSAKTVREFVRDDR